MAALGLVAATSASAALIPIRRTQGDSSIPLVRAGKIVIPAGHARDLTRVIVTLAPPPLAAWSAERRLASASDAQHLNVHTTASRAYVASLQRAQDAAIAQVRQAIPAAQIQEHFSILLDGFTVQLPQK